MPDRGTRIVIVDDNESYRYITRRILERAGYQTAEGTTGDEALRLISEHRPDLVILDVHLPDVSGFEVCQRIKSNPSTAGIPVMHISAICVSTEDKAQGLEGGADAYLVHPIDARELLATVSALLRARRAEEALRRIQWLMHRSISPAEFDENNAHRGDQPYGDLAELNTARLLLDSVGADVLREISGDYLDLLDTSSAIYERHGDYALGILNSGWCRFLDESSRNLCAGDNRAALASGKWICHECCWNEASKVSMDEGRPVDIECKGGIHLYALPIFAGKQVIGSINVGYGDPPRDPAKLKDIAERYQVDVELLKQKAQAYESRPPFIVELAKKRLHSSARLIGEIVERKRAEEELKKAKEAAESASRAKDQFLAMLSHELRTPLTPVVAMLSVLRNATDTPPHITADLEVIRRNVELEARLIDDLLDLTRIARGKLSFNMERIDVYALIANVLEICREEIERKELRITTDLTAAEHWVRADPARLQQVLWNLVKNAVKFTPDGGQITVRAWNGSQLAPAQGSSPLPGARGPLHVAVCDTGIGIDAESLSRIFNAFDQGEAGTNRRFGGLGLGLAISRALMESHGGNLMAWSQGRGQGATFTAIVPTTLSPADDPLTDAQGPGAPESEKSTHACRILLVEDHADTLRIVSRLLQSSTHQVKTATSVAAALELAEREGFDLVVSDLGLPDGSGLELMRELKGRYGLAGIALSGYGMEEDIRMSIEAGFAEHLTKPVDFTQLKDAIGRVTRRNAR